ncbi:uncharacterized protein LOC124639728 [Helicoverpa zea]|uniref:uncharacterized protein LOC124639728 n=1 Tax=Helicoverpa zea TaxID=7113 RepID=UPI001F58E2FB|nr:uncharacterized protein LOC124639728 [Helicoverpa zea]
MSVLLVICLILVTKISANDWNTTQEEDYYNNDDYYNNEENYRKIINEPPGAAALNTNITANKTIIATNITVSNNDTNEGLQADTSQIINSYPPYTSYEVTENVIDIPDDRKPVGPIVTNFTIRPNLNLGKPNNNTVTDEVNGANIKTKKNRVSILHINAEFDNHDKYNEIPNDKFGGIFKGIKNYFHNIHRNIVNSFHSLFHKHQDQHDHGERFD